MFELVPPQRALRERCVFDGDAHTRRLAGDASLKSGFGLRPKRRERPALVANPADMARVLPAPSSGNRLEYFRGMPPKNGSNNGIDDYGNVIVTAQELASAIGLSIFQISVLKRRRVFQSLKARKSEFHLGPSVRAYLQYKCALR